MRGINEIEDVSYVRKDGAGEGSKDEMEDDTRCVTEMKEVWDRDERGNNAYLQKRLDVYSWRDSKCLCFQ